ncbi:MAG: HAMP domain-containing sensor histidine kinase [Dissulfurispiraceae bacterium]|jgi:two-component system sensor histidine kinase BaeS|nr:HAMP domain-containing sensor histidine kinase [Dissulfurispiraceae bacterium]
MRTKIFLAFVSIIIAVLLSNFIFEKFILNDFDEYVDKVKDDQFYWVITSIEDSYNNGRWNLGMLSDAVHWAMMLGINLRITDSTGAEIISSEVVAQTLSPGMLRRLHDSFNLRKSAAHFYEYPLVINGRKTASLFWQPYDKKDLLRKEMIFKQRVNNFLIFSFFIAGGSALIAAYFMSEFLSKPVSNLKKAAERITEGDFNVIVEKPDSSIHRLMSGGEDEVEDLFDAFAKMAESLKREEAIRKKLMSNIAHELRTPLTVIKTQAEAIVDCVMDRERGMANIQSGIDRLTKLIDGIENLAIAEASFLSKGSLEEMELRDFIRCVAAAIDALFKEKGIALNIHNTGPVIIMADAEKLESILRNLLSNALKFTDSGGVDIYYGIDSTEWFIKVSDTGRGIPHEEMPHIFDRFYRADKGSSSGLGLGLAIVKELVYAMGGDIKAESIFGAGASFTVTFPVKETSSDA